MIKVVGLLSALLFVSAPDGSQAASGDQDFYKGKTIRIIVGFAAGGGFDVYARPSLAICRSICPAIFNDRR
jgi:tripartite-type tricarboxylate transporter receptor subunit TctC